MTSPRLQVRNVPSIKATRIHPCIEDRGKKRRLFIIEKTQTCVPADESWTVGWIMGGMECSCACVPESWFSLCTHAAVKKNGAYKEDLSYTPLRFSMLLGLPQRPSCLAVSYKERLEGGGGGVRGEDNEVLPCSSGNIGGIAARPCTFYCWLQPHQGSSYIHSAGVVLPREKSWVN